MYRHPNPEAYLQSLAGRVRRGRSAPPAGRSRSKSRGKKAPRGKGRGQTRRKGWMRAEFAEPMEAWAEPRQPLYLQAEARQPRYLQAETRQPRQPRYLQAQPRQPRYLQAQPRYAQPPGRRLQAEARRLQPALIQTGAHKHKPRKAWQNPSDYEVVGLIERVIGDLAAGARNPEAKFEDIRGPPVDLDKILEAGAKLADDLMSGTGFFQGRNEKRLPGVALQYLHHKRDLSKFESPPEFLAKFHAVEGGSGGGTGQEKYQAVLRFLSHLKRSARKAIKEQASLKIHLEHSKEFAAKLAEKFHVEGGELRGVLERCAAKVAGMNKNELNDLVMDRPTTAAVCMALVRLLVQDKEGKDVHWEVVAGLIYREHPDHVHFFEARRVLFQDCVKKVQRGLKKKEFVEKIKESKAAPPAEAQFGAGDKAAQPAGLSKAAQPAALGSRLVSMRYDA